VVAPPPTPVRAELPLDRRVSWILHLEATRQLREATLGTEVTPPDPLVLTPAREADLRALILDTNAAVRRRAALAIGRVRDGAGRQALEARLTDPEGSVRAAAAFGLGLLGDPQSESALRAVLADANPEVRGRAAEALGLVAAQVSGPRERFRESATAVADRFAGCASLLVGMAEDDPGATPDEAGACRLAIFALVRLGDFGAVARVVLDEQARPRSTTWPVAYALQRANDPRAVPALRALARVPDVATAAFALRGLGRDPEALTLAQRLATDTAVDARLRATAIRTLGQPDTPVVVPVLIELLRTKTLELPLLLETMSAIGAARAVAAFEHVVDLLTDRRAAVRAAALPVAARLDPEGFLLVVTSLPPDPEWSVRAALASSLAGLDPDRVRVPLVELVTDQDQRVQAPALRALAQVGAPDLDARLISALKAPDYVVRAAAADVIGRRRLAMAVAPLNDAYTEALPDAAADARRSIVDAAAAIGTPDAMAIVARARADREWSIRVRALAILSATGQPVEAAGPAPLRRPAEYFESAALLYPSFSPVALIETRLGVIEVALNVVDAPLTTQNFIDLARAGFYNGLRIHRHVPNFVVQAGDPRGDGAGGPGYTLGDELSALPFVRGTVGMATAGPDTGGSQFFITLSPSPHLDARYTAFGQVVKGLDIVDRLAVGDVIERLRIWDGVTLR
jgi:cyclophilin family peptidyl-prolyl cis-trans isomerase/HEAT repeat protein